MDQKIISQDALPDTRPINLQEKDYSTQEVATASIPTFKNKQITKLTATEFNQWYVGSCVPHGFLTQLEYEGISKPTVSSNALTGRYVRLLAGSIFGAESVV